MGTGQHIERETYYDTFLEDMSVHGYCAAVVEYPGSSFLHYAWTDFPAKRAAIFTTTPVPVGPPTAVEAASDGACRCDQLVVHGFSQGGYNPHVTGILLFSGPVSSQSPGCLCGVGKEPDGDPQSAPPEHRCPTGWRLTMWVR